MGLGVAGSYSMFQTLSQGGCPLSGGSCSVPAEVASENLSSCGMVVASQGSPSAAQGHAVCPLTGEVLSHGASSCSTTAKAGSCSTEAKAGSCSTTAEAGSCSTGTEASAPQSCSADHPGCDCGGACQGTDSCCAAAGKTAEVPAAPQR
ncbi:MAG: hypothetical protein C0475_08625 [Planctomyces sp.]|nr:hypothetical protein [Planctomyces sp.]